MISFLHPWVLAGLAAAGVPLLLHLIARRQPPTIAFPAVRYLVDVTREHQRRLKFRHWLLLLVRTFLVIAVVLAAAGPSAPIRRAGNHAPSALVLVLDNSPSSGAVVAGTPVLTNLRAAARRVLERATPEDALWLLTADGLPRHGDQSVLLRLLDSLGQSSHRLDLGASLNLAGGIIAADSRPGQIVLVSDLQASALSSAQSKAPILVVRPEGPAIPNRGVKALDPGPQPWTMDGGTVLASVAGDSGGPVPISIRLGDRIERKALAAVGSPVRVTLPGVLSGWWTLRAQLDPDELRLDDERRIPIRVAPAARVAWSAGDRYIAAACEVLEGGGRIRKGTEVSLGQLGPGVAIVQPPRDPAELGALNRALQQRGAGWGFGRLLTVSTVSDSGALVGRERVTRRYLLERTGRPDSGADSGTNVLATAGGSPWIVRGAGVVLLGSRLDPEWTGLPLAAGFVPFIDAMVNRLARGGVAVHEGAPGDPVLLPDAVTEVREGNRSWPVEGGAGFRAQAPGTYFLLANRDTVGALAINLDPRESELGRADDETVRRLWPGARIVPERRAGDEAFTGAARSDLRGLLLGSALLLGLAEVLLASGWRRAR